MRPHRVASVRPCVRVSPEDGFQLRETVVECVQYLKMTAAELPPYGLRRPRSMPDDAEVALEGGLDVGPRRVRRAEVRDPQPAARPSARRGQAPTGRTAWISYLWERGYLSGLDRSASLATFHLSGYWNPRLRATKSKPLADAKPRHDE